MAPDPSQNGALAPIEGALTTYMKEMNELSNENMPEVIVHEYTPFFDSSDMGPNEWVSVISVAHMFVCLFVCLFANNP